MRIGAFMAAYRSPLFFTFAVFANQVGPRIGGIANVVIGTPIP